MATELTQPSTMPKRPPITLNTVASTRNWSRMSRRLAPTALRMPISRVRSVTLTSMMFMMPIPPTSREMPAIEPRKSVSTPVIWLKTATRSAWLMTEKSSSSRKRMLCRSRNRRVMSSVACSMRSSLATWT